MMEMYLRSISGTTLFIWAFVLQLLAAEGGFQLSRLINPPTDAHGDSHLGTVQASIIGLLALLLSFTFSMASTRYDTRKALVLEETNAIGTAYLRAEYLPAPYNQNFNKLLREYLDVRIAYFKAGDDSEKMKMAIDQTEDLQRQLWNQTVALVKIDKSVPTGLFIQQLNDLIDLHTTEMAAMINRIPPSIFLLLLFVAIISSAFMGYTNGISQKRLFLSVAVMALLVSSVMTLIVDLHRPRRGMIQITPQLLENFRASLNK